MQDQLCVALFDRAAWLARIEDNALAPAAKRQALPTNDQQGKAFQGCGLAASPLPRNPKKTEASLISFCLSSPCNQKQLLQPF